MSNRFQLRDPVANGDDEGDGRVWDMGQLELIDTLYEPPRRIYIDGGEPEDQSFGRDWNWVPDQLNKLNDDIEYYKNFVKEILKTKEDSANRFGND